MLKYALNYVLRKIFGTKAERDQRKYWPRVMAVNAFADEIRALSDAELRAKTDELRGRYLEAKGTALFELLPEIDLGKLTNDRHREQLTNFLKAYEEFGPEAVKEVQHDLDLRKLKGEDAIKLDGLEKRYHAFKIAALDELLPEAFAVVREAAERTIHERHYDAQIYGGMVLYEGKIAEMATGEGKTLAATLPVYLMALAGEGAHVVTVNDYLAKRDRDWMGQIYEFLGMTVGAIQHDLDYDQRRKAYHCDITYGTNNEFGFDYLRDNMARHLEECVQRRLFYCIVDEVDSILIDEARTPLIISGTSEESTDKYYIVDKIIPRLAKGEDYEVDEKDRNVHLTEAGAEKAQRLLGIDNMFDEENLDLVHFVNTALKAHTLFKIDEEYVIQDGEIIIVDEFTGRLMTGRRYSDGLHQAIEAKEGVKIRQEQQTLATITFQNFFRLYKRLAGMTGTADTEAIEFQEIYGLEVVVIPTNRPVVRADYSDVIYRTTREKLDAVVAEIEELNKKGQPILVGTVDIEKSEQLSKLLKRKSIRHKVLNAKFHREEAEIVAQAGRQGAVTIATNMAGRGTDIKLGGDPEGLARVKLHKDRKPEEITPEEWTAAVAEARAITEKEKEIVKEAGGLHILGTERHESRRIDNQLRGRSGRQGDPGSSRFFLSLEDDLLRIFGSERLKTWATRLGMQEGEAIEARLVSRSIEKAQKRVEEHHFDMRKNVLKYDDVMEKQRTVIYEMRRDLLEGDNPRNDVLLMVDDVIDDLVEIHAPKKSVMEEWDLDAIQANLRTHFGITDPVDMTNVGSPETLAEEIRTMAVRRFEERVERLEQYDFTEFQRHVLLHVIDVKWKENLLNMDHLRDAIGLRGYGGKEPIQEYQREGFEMFEEMYSNVESEVVRILFNVEFQANAEDAKAKRRQMLSRRRQGPLIYGAPRRRPDAQGGDASQVPTRRVTKKVGRNDPCPCGSGKKYKHCCGAGE